MTSFACAGDGYGDGGGYAKAVYAGTFDGSSVNGAAYLGYGGNSDPSWRVGDINAIGNVPPDIASQLDAAVPSPTS